MWAKARREMDNKLVWINLDRVTHMEESSDGGSFVYFTEAPVDAQRAFSRITVK